MVGLGLLIFALGAAGPVVASSKPYRPHGMWFQRIAVAMGPAGFVAMLAGWTVTEAGR